MTCCLPGDSSTLPTSAVSGIEADDAALLALSRKLGDGGRQLEFAVPDAHCAACIRSIETGLTSLTGVSGARVNLTKRRVRVTFDPERIAASALAPAILASGYHTFVLDPAQDRGGDPVLAELVKALAVAGFAAGNIMLFSVSVWSGANEATRDLFHWLSALIALPAIAYSGRIFFRSAWRALRVGRTNMDVPISIGVLLATALSLFEITVSGPHAYFDASTMLLFFLLIGRTLDHLMREKARSAITGLARLQPRGAVAIREDGRREYLRLDEIGPGTVLELKAGERVPVDSTVLSADALLDYAIVTGESAPQALAEGATVVAGANNLGGVIRLRAEKASADSFLSRMAAMMDIAEQARTRPRRIADRAAQYYAPAVHVLAAATFLGWGLIAGDWHVALLNAVAVLIITCPCALALAVPIVHVVAAGRLFEQGILMKDGAALERAADADSVAFDKTGTLTEGRPRIVDHRIENAEAGRAAAALAASSTHPLSRAVSDLMGPAEFDVPVTEVAGKGTEVILDGKVWRLGSAGWCGVTPAPDDNRTTVWLSRDGQMMGGFRFADTPRPDAASAVAELQGQGLAVRLLSGDLPGAVMAAASAVGIAEARARLTPADKLADVARGRTMMVGDGINDAPSMRAAHVSMAPSTAADIGRTAADFVFTTGRLAAVPLVIRTARRATRLVNQNLALAIGYNVVAVPLAVAGHVTPLIAAVAMSLSSLIVVLNDMRLRFASSSSKHVSAGPIVLDSLRENTA